MKKKILSLLMVFAITIFNFVPFINVYAEPSNPEKVYLQFDGATILGNVITFDVDGTNVTATVSGNGYQFTDGKLEITYQNLGDVKITLDNNFDGMSMQLHDGTPVVVNGDKEIVLFDIDFTNDNLKHIQIVKGNQGGGPGDDTSNHQGNGTSTLNYSINGALDYYREYDQYKQSYNSKAKSNDWWLRNKYWTSGDYFEYRDGKYGNQDNANSNTVLLLHSV